ncbi:hypothetical protein GJ904_19975 [Salmonella enterica]|nr:hypothetical protein [Salmonella enterica subsp. enterica serovar Saintpaul]EEC1303343.1 hypothetical protein [Salmonella enterica]
MKAQATEQQGRQKAADAAAAAAVAADKQARDNMRQLTGDKMAAVGINSDPTAAEAAARNVTAISAMNEAKGIVQGGVMSAPEQPKGMVHAVSTPVAAPAESTPAAPAAAPSVKAVNEGTPSQTGSINVSASSLAPSTPVSVDGKVTTAGALAPETQVAVPHSPALIASHNGGNHDRARSESRSGSNGRGSDNAHSHAFGGHGYGHDNSRSEGFGGHSHFH